MMAGLIPILMVCRVLATTMVSTDEKPEDGLPLETTRSIEFTTDEASWLSLDVSPDGKELVFSILGDLYCLPIEGGEAERITDGLAFDCQPVYSPDGEWIAFITDRDGDENLWVARADGSDARALSKGTRAIFTSPAWSPDGQYVLVSRAPKMLNAYGLWMYHIHGGPGMAITESPPSSSRGETQKTELGVAPSKDGRFLYYAVRPGGTRNPDFPTWQVVRRNRHSGDEDVIVTRPGSAFRPRVSPSGKVLVYATRHDGETGLRVREVESGEDRWLKYPVQRDDAESFSTQDLYPGYAFLPDGKEIVVTYGGRIHRIDLDSGADTVIPFNAKVSLELGPRLNFPRAVETGPIRARLIQGASPSPLGDRIAFSALTRLYTMNLESGEPLRLESVTERAFHPAWSPDGKDLVYVSWGTDGGHLYRVEADGSSAPRQLSRVPSFYSDPVWSPDGTKIVVLRGSRQDRVESGFSPLDVVWLPADGGEAHLVATSPGFGRPHFGSEDDRVYFDAGGELVSMRLDGTVRRHHLKVLGPQFIFTTDPTPADDIRISPDGKWALTHSRHQLYLCAVPRFGGSVPTVNIRAGAVPVRQLTSIGVDEFDWADEGRLMTWSIGSTFYRRSFDSVDFHRAEKNASGEKTDDEEVDEEATGDEASENEAEAESFQVVVEAPRATPKGTLVLRGARVITMREGQDVLEQADVVIVNNRIEAIGPTGTVEVPDDAKVFFMLGKTIVPGFIDTHAHWRVERGVLELPLWSFLANVAYGVTSGLDVQTGTNDMFAYQDLIDMGETIGPRLFSTGPGVFSKP